GNYRVGTWSTGRVGPPVSVLQSSPGSGQDSLLHGRWSDDPVPPAGARHVRDAPGLARPVTEKCVVQFSGHQLRNYGLSFDPGRDRTGQRQTPQAVAA